MTGPALWFEEFQEGQTFESASHTPSRDEIIAFAQDWDPQPFHLDDAAAAKTVFGGIIASGIHTVALTSRLLFDLGILNGTAIAGLGLDELRFHKPVFPGDTLRVRAKVIQTRPTSKPGQGTVSLAMETLNQHGQRVYSAQLSVLVSGRSGS
ncbi:MaoC family dehydratase [Gemmobacter sp.]|uniref:MaoC family dehydratase n=1 Tax=Gemmobacter sp. TaxID=1898957 RepID=UPI002AFF9DCF|nr:MaoC family dehydratase [Gemmobacter sp.]